MGGYNGIWKRYTSRIVSVHSQGGNVSDAFSLVRSDAISAMRQGHCAYEDCPTPEMIHYIAREECDARGIEFKWGLSKAELKARAAQRKKVKQATDWQIWTPEMQYREFEREYGR